MIDCVRITASLLLSLCAVNVAEAADARLRARPNVILCMADDQGWGDVGYNGHPVLKTPHLDALAATGLRFDRFYAAAPVCSPTRGSVMTGRHPNRFGCFSWGLPIRPQEITIAEALKSAGYVTGHFGKWHLGSVQKGSPVNPGAKGFDEWLSAPNFYDNNPILSREGVAIQLKGESSMVAVDAALEFIRKHAEGPQPMFVVVWFGSPHSPHQAGKEDFDLYPEQPAKLANFYGEISGMDRAVGKLRSELKTLGLRENTLLWYCSDNGGLADVGSTGGRGHKGDVYEGGLRVPAIIEWPSRITQPRITTVPAGTVDMFPTLLEIAGVRADDRRPLDGVSLVSLLDGQMPSRPKPLGFWDYPTKGVQTPSKEWMADLLAAQQKGDEIGNPDHLNRNAGKITHYPQGVFTGHSAWLDWPWKLHRIERPNAAVRLELYNLAEDPQEKSDLSAREASRTEAMRAELEKWLTSVVESLNGEDYGRSPAAGRTDGR